jgi:precorrin-4/cobalt-precorrin-4 C11-methyltransferase
MEVGVVMYLSWSSTLNHGYLKTSARFAKEMGGVLAIYTGVHVIDSVVKELTEGGLLPTTSVGGIYKVSWSNEKIVGTLADIAERVKGTVMLMSSSVKPTEPPRSSVYNLAFSHSYCRTKS